MSWTEMPRRRVLPPVSWALAVLRAFGRDIFLARSHKIHVQQQLAGLITRRLKLVATIWFLMTLAWLPVDLVVLPRHLWLEFTLVRLVSAAGFGFLGQLSHSHDLPVARWRLFLFFSMQMVCALPAIELASADNLPWLAFAIHSAYDDLPFALIVAIGLFPLFLLDAVAAAAGMILTAMAIGMVQHIRGLESFDPVTVWLLVLVGALSVLSSAAQMQTILFQMEQAGRDPLTGALPRRAGEEVLGSEMGVAKRHGSALTLIFVDLDRFKSVNDQYGHDAGDVVLRAAADRLRQALRAQDSIIRWGGEEFVIVLPQTTAGGAEQLLDRLAAIGLGDRPDGKPQTASLGVAEFAELGTQKGAGWAELVTLADQRMYAAKQAGRNRIGLAGGFKPFLPAPEAA